MREAALALDLAQGRYDLGLSNIVETDAGAVEPDCGGD
jgi:hypothetical protein